MGNQSRRKPALSSATATPSPSSLKFRGLEVRKKPPIKASAPIAVAQVPNKTAGKSNVLNEKTKNITGRLAVPSQTTSSPEPKLPYLQPTPIDLTEFENANLIHQKRLKVNNSQITKVTFDFSDLKARYMTTLTNPPTTTAAFRTHILLQLERLCTRHLGLLNVRKEMLEKQQGWLEKAMAVQAIQDSDGLLMAIDIQIEAAKDLNQRQDQGALMQECAWF